MFVTLGKDDSRSSRPTEKKQFLSKDTREAQDIEPEHIGRVIKFEQRDRDNEKVAPRSALQHRKRELHPLADPVLGHVPTSAPATISNPVPGPDLGPDPGPASPHVFGPSMEPALGPRFVAPLEPAREPTFGPVRAATSSLPPRPAAEAPNKEEPRPSGSQCVAF